jgi:hypothetical protein
MKTLVRLWLYLAEFFIESASCSVLLTKYYSGDQIKKTEMGRACSMHIGEEKCIQGFTEEIWGKETTCKAQV